MDTKEATQIVEKYIGSMNAYESFRELAQPRVYTDELCEAMSIVPITNKLRKIVLIRTAVLHKLGNIGSEALSKKALEITDAEIDEAINAYSDFDPEHYNHILFGDIR